MNDTAITNDRKKAVKYRISVTRAHINAGIAAAGDRCPVALAIREQTPFKWAILDDGLIFLDTDDKEDHENGIETDGVIEIPEAVSKFVSDFDTSNKTKPFTFILRRP